VTSGEDSDETGIVGADGRGYILEDRSGKYTPDEWARQACVAYYRWKADRTDAERAQALEKAGTAVPAEAWAHHSNIERWAEHATKALRPRKPRTRKI
jgi:phage terminase large subunit-like protein